MLRRLAFVGALALAGCARPDPGPPPPAAAPTRAAVPSAATPASVPASAPQAAAPQVFQAQLMGTPWALTLAGASPAQARAAADAAFTEIARLEGLLSEWRPGSEISRINAAAGQAAVAVGPEVFEVVRTGRALGEATRGAFDITWAALRGLWDFKAALPRLPTHSALAAAVAHIDYRQVILDPTARTVRLARPGMAVGLGGIAKGYAIDRAAQILRAKGLTAFIVDGGGDLYLAGEKAPGVPWRVGVRHPRADRLLSQVAAGDAAVVSSGDYERFFELGGRRYHHILDPATGLPADRSVAVTVQAPTAMRADALATALFVLGPAEGLAVARQQPDVEAAILAPDGTIHTTDGLRAAFPARWRD